MKTTNITVLLCTIAYGLFAQTWVPQPSDIPTQFSSRYHWADLDGDGDTDVLEYGSYNGVTIHTRNGNSFTPTQSGLPDNFLREEIDFRLNDYDNDGDLDIIFSRYNDVAIGINNGSNSFTATDTNIIFNNDEYGSIYWQDLDGDLDLDVVHNETIYLNNNGIYARSANTLSPDIRRMVWGDINNDGLIDLLVTIGYDQYSGNPFQVLINRGNGNFQSVGLESELRVHDNSPLLLFDANNDGVLDIMLMDQLWGRCFVLRNISSGGQIEFASPYSLGMGYGATAARAGDLDADGLADIVISGYTNSAGAYQVSIFKNTSAGNNVSFSRTTSLPSSMYVNSLHLIDYDSDNDLDIHMKVYDPNAYVENNTVLINTGTTAGPAPAVPLNLTSTVTDKVGLAWTGVPQLSYNIEFKRNGQVIRVNPTTTSGKLLLTENGPLISSQAFSVYSAPAGSYTWRVQSVDKTGRTSAFSAVGTFDISPAPAALTLQILGMTSVKLCWNAVTNATSYTVYRKLNDGTMEEIATTGSSTLCYTDASLQKNSYYEYCVRAVTSGAYSAPSQTVKHYSAPFVPNSFGTLDPNIIAATCHPADIDLDGDYDLQFIGRIESSFGTDLSYRNDGNGNFPQKISILPTSDVNKVVSVRDMDNDGDTDFCVVVGSEYSWQKFVVLINNSGTLELGFQTPDYLAMSQVSVADFNNDGRPDLLYRHSVGNGVGNPGVYELLFQEADGTFTDSKFRFTESDYGALGQFLVADLNNDGFQDICFTGTQDESAQFFINDGGMSFTKHATELKETPLAFLDVDGDGITDFVGGDYRWYKGTADFQFTKQQVLHDSYNTSNSMGVQMADFDLDGLPDFIICDGYRTSVAFSKGNGLFELGTLELDGHWGSSFALTDLENDGDIDIVKLGNDSQHQGYNFLYLNQAKTFGATNARPSIPTGLTAAYSSGKLNINWQPSTDDKTPANMLSYSLWIRNSAGKAWLHGETDATGQFKRQLTPGNAGYRTSFTLRDLPAGTYKVRVQAIDAAYASSAWSGEITATITAGPTNLQVERILLNKVKLTWTGSAFAEQKVIVERKSVDSEFMVIAELPAGSTNFTDENLPYNKYYQYRITEASNTTTTASSNIGNWSTIMWIVNETTLPNMYGSLDIADYTNDGKMDILINGGRSYDGHNSVTARAAFENTPSGWLQHDITPSLLSTVATFRFFDLDADHNLDLYQQGYTWAEGFKTEVFMNNGDKTFSPATNEFTQHAYEIQSFYDVDMDNDLDISVVDRANGDVKKFLRNNGSGNYTTQAPEDPDCGTPCSGNVIYADFDGDGDDDVVRYDYSNFSVFLTKPEGEVFTGITFPSYENKMGVLDFNGDGLADIALLTSSYYTSSRLYVNRGIQDGELKFEMIRNDLPSGENHFNVADFDHDGYQDIALISPAGTIYRNTGQGTFDKYQIPYYTFGGHSGIVDFDNDGDLDIFVMGTINYQYTSSEQQFARILVNQTIDAGKGLKNDPPPAPGSLSTEQKGPGILLKWVDGVDDHTPPTALTHDVILYREGKEIYKAALDPVTGLRQRLAPGRHHGHAIISNLEPGTYTWKVQAVDQSYKGSALSAGGSFLFLPAPPLVKDTVVYRCGRDITITAIGNDIRWYSDQDMTHLIATGDFHPTQSQVVYATQKINGYEGVAQKVTITIMENTPQPTVNPVTYCENSTGFLYLYAPGDGIRWYANANKTQLLGTGQYYDVAATERTYYVTQTLGGCESEPLAVPVTKITINSEIFGSTDRLEVKEKDASVYAWYKNNVYVPNSNSSSIPYNGETASYYVYIIKNNCSEFSKLYNMPNDLVTGVEETNDSEWSVYPNPATGNFTIDVANLNGLTKVYDATGRIIYSAPLGSPSGTSKTDLIRVPAGIYLVTLDDGTRIRSKRVVVY